MPRNNTQSSLGKEGSEKRFSSPGPISQIQHFLSSGQQNGYLRIPEIPASPTSPSHLTVSVKITTRWHQTYTQIEMDFGDAAGSSLFH